MPSKRPYALGAVIVVVLMALCGFAYRLMAPAVPSVLLEGLEPSDVAAIRAAESQVLHQPRSGNAWGVLAVTLSNRGFSKAAGVCFGHAARLSPTEPRWRFLQAMELAKAGAPRDAIPLLEEARATAQTQEEQAAILFWLARILIDEGELDRAGQVWRVLSQTDRNAAQVEYVRGILAYARRDHLTALAALSTLTEHVSARRVANQLLASLTQIDRERAHAYATRAAHLPPDLPWPNPFLARGVELGNESTPGDPHTESVGTGQVGQHLLNDRYRDFDAAFGAGVALLRARELEQAIRAFEAAIAFDSTQARVHLLLAGALVDLGEARATEPEQRDRSMALIREGLVSAERALTLRGGWSDAYLVCGRAHYDLGQIKPAIEAFRAAVQSRPDSAEAHLELGLALASGGSTREGLKHLEDAVKLAPPEDRRPKAALEEWRLRARSESR